jgi:aldehyde dehydrogenase (NAD+)
MNKQFAYTQAKLFIGGAWVDPLDGELVPSIDPATGESWALTAFGGVRDIDRAVEAAQEALRGPWGRMPVAERAALIRSEPDRVYRRRWSSLLSGDLSREFCVVEVPFCCCG